MNAIPKIRFLRVPLSGGILRLGIFLEASHRMVYEETEICFGGFEIILGRVLLERRAGDEKAR